jgi:hypothetical protein
MIYALKDCGVVSGLCDDLPRAGPQRTATWNMSGHFHEYMSGHFHEYMSGHFHFHVQTQPGAFDHHFLSFNDQDINIT